MRPSALQNLGKNASLCTTMFNLGKSGPNCPHLKSNQQEKETLDTLEMCEADAHIKPQLGSVCGFKRKK